MGTLRFFSARRRRRSERLLLFVLGAAIISAGLFATALPYDSKIRLFFNGRRREWLSPPAGDLQWLSQPPAYPVDWMKDVGFVMKSGFGTRQRIPAWFEAMREVGDVLLIADFATKAGEHYSTKDGRQLPVHDAVGRLFDQGLFSAAELEHPRTAKYRDMSAAIAHGGEEAEKMSKEYGWELDAMKFISGLEMAYKQMPDKKWYLLVDDDTYIVQSSMMLLLERLSPDREYYIGNPVGNWLCRFGHGGSSVIISAAAMRKLFSPASRPVVARANHEALDETWGDRLLAQAFIRIGVYLDETYATLFNGELVEKSWIRADRFCAPVVSFHGHRDPEDMRRTGERFRDVRRPIRWIDIWGMSGAQAPEEFKVNPWKIGWDHVGRLDERIMTSTGVQSAEQCHRACRKTRRGKCLAWTWYEKEKKCVRAPWMLVGRQVQGRITGLNEDRVAKLAAACQELPWTQAS